MNEDGTVAKEKGSHKDMIKRERIIRRAALEFEVHSTHLYQPYNSLLP